MTKTTTDMMQNALAFNKVYIPFEKTNKPYFAGAMTISVMMMDYGLRLDMDTVTTLAAIGRDQQGEWWKSFKTALDKHSLVDLEMDRGVVYKDFPNTSMSLNDAKQLQFQMITYANGHDDGNEVPKEMAERFSKCTVVSASGMDDQANALAAKKSSWNDEEKAYFTNFGKSVSVDEIKFNDNLVWYALQKYDTTGKIAVFKNPNNILRVFEAISETRKLKKKDIRMLAKMVDVTNLDNLGSTLISSKSRWKKFFIVTHLQSYMKDKNAKQIIADFFDGNLVSDNRKIEQAIKYFDKTEFSRNELLARAGMVLRLFTTLYKVNKKSEHLIPFVKQLVTKLDIKQLATLKNIVKNPSVKTRFIPPKGNWNKVKQIDDVKVYFAPKFTEAVSQIVDARMKEVFERTGVFANGANLCEGMKNVYLPDDMQTSRPYGSGTRLPLPKDTNFIRMASYWESVSTIWYDIGVGLHDKDMQMVDTSCWNHNDREGCTKFSGDPSTSDTNIKGCQIVDLDIKKSLEKGIRYVTFNTLCYSNKPFSEGQNVYASMQFLHDNTKGKLFDPKQMHLAMHLTNDGLSNINAVIDLETMEYMIFDQPLRLNVQSMQQNYAKMSEMFPYFMEKYSRKVSVYDILGIIHSEDKNAVPFLMNDHNGAVVTERAFMCERSDPLSNFTDINLSSVGELK